MPDPRYAELAGKLVTNSCQIKEGEKVLIEAFDLPELMVVALVRAVRAAGGVPFVTLKNNRVLRELYREATAEQMQLAGEVELSLMKQMDAYIAMRGSTNIAEMSDVPSDNMQLYQTHWLQPVHFQERVPNTKWVVLRWPTASMAQQAEMSSEQFEDFYFDVCCLDYRKMGEAIEPLRELMNRTDRVRLTGPDTDLRFSIKDIPAIACSGDRNIPDGECFTAPVRDSIEGHIHFNARTLYHGTIFSDVRLEFKGGKVVGATSNNTDKLNEILDSDEGARYVGEFAIAFNPLIREPMLDILFDEKIDGSFHFTPGNAYDEADNGNRSEVHWDMVMIQRAEHGGGEIIFDDVVIRKDGRFVLPELEGLNPENLT
ncbi:MAG: aminopeptidase [Planctomycetaceae bacterium]|nr:aminopeptidase [Planctomycetaceae bacterium]